MYNTLLHCTILHTLLQQRGLHRLPLSGQVSQKGSSPHVLWHSVHVIQAYNTGHTCVGEAAAATLCLRGLPPGAFYSELTRVSLSLSLYVCRCVHGAISH